jgi:diguanylate cyclase
MLGKGYRDRMAGDTGLPAPFGLSSAAIGYQQSRMKPAFIPQDPKQAVRIRRLFIATGTSLVVIVLMLICASFDFITTSVFARAALAIVFWNVLFYAIFRAGLNLKAKDPSLTAAQMLAACLTMLYVMYHAGAARGAFLLIILMIFVFGIFRLGTREFLGLSVVVLAAYAGMIWWLHEQGKSTDLRLEILQWVVLAVVLPWFALMGGYIGRLRRRLSESISELESSQALAIRDDLTGSYNRRYLMGALYKEKNRSDRGREPFCICLIDLDRFKSVNDTKGHLIGDVVLKTFAAAVQAHLRSTDYFGRFGGEEFMLILSETSLKGASYFAERVRVEAETLRFPESPDLHVTVSVGVAQYRPREETASVLARADAALYHAKATGRNRVVNEDQRQVTIPGLVVQR